MKRTCNDCYQMRTIPRQVAHEVRFFCLCAVTGHTISPNMTACRFFEAVEGPDGQEYESMISTVVPAVAGM